ncbi:MAG TPA: amidohydrolase family protein [Methylomirabilota bacterium]|nr:amidohydrolase family protein [Methylomirabilota bacterium]
MSHEGIDVAVVYPSRGLFALAIPDMDPRLAAAMARAYNDWLHEFCQENPERLLGSGMISPFDVDDAVAEARRGVRELGFRAMLLRQVGEQFGANTMLKHVYSHPVEQMLTAGAFCAGGILERHPRLRVAFLATAAGCRSCSGAWTSTGSGWATSMRAS